MRVFKSIILSILLIVYIVFSVLCFTFPYWDYILSYLQRLWLVYPNWVEVLRLSNIALLFVITIILFKNKLKL